MIRTLTGTVCVDPTGRTVRAQGGVLWRELNRETQVHGLATTGGVVGSTGRRYAFGFERISTFGLRESS